MTDIAILVAEEFERRMSYAKKEGRDSEAAQIDLVSCASVLAQSIKQKIGENQKMDYFVKWAIREPKTQIGLAASSGFFSA